MREKEYVTPSRGIKVEWKGIFDAEALYKKIKYWLDLKGYGGNFEEEEYSEISKGDAKTIGIRWYAEKKMTGYFGFVFEISIVIRGMKDVQAERDGVRLSMNSGDFNVHIAGYLVKDVGEKYTSKLAQKIYERIIIKSRVDSMKGLLASQVYELQDEIKRLLALP